MSPRAWRPTASLGALFDEHFAYVWNALRRLGVRAADLEDIAHDVFVRVGAHLDEYDPARPVRPWLFGFAYRVASEQRRRARNRLEVFGSGHEPVDPARPADERIAAEEERALLEAALDSLALDRRALIILHELEGVPMSTIARELRIPINTAHSRLRLARSALTDAVRRAEKRGGSP